MVSLTLSALTLGLEALSTALPASLPTNRNLSPNEFTLALISEDYGRLSLNTIESGVLGNLDLVFDGKPGFYVGKSAYLNNTMLELDTSNFTSIDGSKTFPYGVRIEPVGDDYGYTTPVVAGFGNAGATKGFEVNGYDEIVPPIDAALQSFFACNSTLNGVERLQLRFGVYKADGSDPDGCSAASLVQEFNQQ